MNNFEKKKLHILNLQAPNELEARLTNALKQQPKKRTNKPIFLIAAVALLFLTITFNINGFAYYGKKLFGNEELMTDTLKELNEKGLGQTVEQSIQLNDETIVTIDGIVSDMNRVIVYYREENKEQPLHDNFSFNKIEGFLTNAYFSSGSSQTNNDGHQRTGIAVFDAVSPFAKKLALSIRDNDSGEQYTLNFPYKANEAIPVTLKHALNHKFKTDIGIIKVQHIISTGASTLITGKFTPSIDRYLNSTININLYADGKLIPWQQSGKNSSLFGGDNFEIFYDAIPANTKKLEIKLEDFNAYEKVADSFAIEKEVTYKVGPKKFRMIDFTQQNNQTLITIASEYNITFDQVSLQTETNSIPLETTTYVNDSSNEFIRTLIFETTDQPLKLFIEGMYFIKNYDESIEIPLN